MSTSGYVRFFEDFGIDDVPLVGGKNASLGEMLQKLAGQGVRVPHGFAITAAAYRYMLDEAGAWDRLHAELDDLDPADIAALARKAKRAREIVYGAGLPDDLDVLSRPLTYITWEIRSADITEVRRNTIALKITATGAYTLREKIITVVLNKGTRTEPVPPRWCGRRRCAWHIACTRPGIKHCRSAEYFPESR